MKKKLGHLLTRLVVLISVVTLLPLTDLPAQAATSDLFFSEYIEGSSYNKALEIYNGTGAAIDLAAGEYNIQMYFNGSGNPGFTINLTGSIADGDVYVVAPTNATDLTIIAQADQMQGTSWFNGDDAVVLRKGATIIDVIGQIGFDPGSEWGTGLTSTADNTLRRKDTVCTGDPDGSDVFDPAIEWDGFENNTFDGLGVHTANCGAPVQAPKINEFVFNHVGTDTHEYVEIFGNPNTDYSTFTILQIEGDNTGPGVIDSVHIVGTTDANGFWVTDFLSNVFENGTVTLLLVEDFTGSVGDGLDTNNDGVLDVTPWLRIVDDVAVSDGGTGDWTYSSTVLAPGFGGSAFTPGGASRIPDGADTDSVADWVLNDFDGAGLPGFAGSLDPDEALNTPGAPNEIYSPPPEACGDLFTPIYDVQGSGMASPLVGVEVAVEGIVVGDFQNNDQPDNGDLNGFYIQDAVGDGDPSTSDGVFVYAPGAIDVVVGDHVRVRGKPAEYYDLTQISSVTQVWVCSSGHTVTPTEIFLPVASPDDLEPYEGMLVTFPQTLYISEYFNFDRYGEIVLTTERQYQPTAVYEPGSPEAFALAQANLLGRIMLDDGRSIPNPDPAIHPNGSIFDMTNLFRGGDVVQNVTGVMDYSFGLYRIQPTQGANYTATNLRTDQPDDVGGNVKVASFNVLNYFTTIDTGAWICGPSEDQECRGADTDEEFTRQRAKIVAALSAIDADVVGLIEIENHPGDVPAADLVAGLNDVLGAGTYDYVATGAIGTDAIRQAFIYKPAVVSPFGGYAVLDGSVDGRFIDTKNRPALAQTFQNNTTGGLFTVAVNHLKSKGSDCNDIGDPDLGDGAGNCNLTRTYAAEALVDWLASDPTGSGDGDFLIIGDLNAYDKEDPIDALIAGGYTDLVSHFQGEYAYSYVFNGQLGYLDHALANANLMEKVTGVTVWHINADEPDLIDYDMTFKQPAQDALYAPDAYRSSDHDPIIIGLNVCDEVAPVLEVSVTPNRLWPANHKYVTVIASVTATDNFDPQPTIRLVSVTSNEPDNGQGDGDTAMDIVIIDDYTFWLRAERSGTGTGRVYTITYEAIDSCGNSTLASATVTVPRDRRP